MTLITSDPLVELQKAMLSTLAGDSTLQAMAFAASKVQVFDRVSDAVFPYIVIGEDREAPDDITCASITDIDATVRIYSREVGKLEAKTIAGRVRWLLDRGQGFAIPGFELIAGFCEGINVHSHQDGLTTQAELNFTYRAVALDLSENVLAVGAVAFAPLAATANGMLPLSSAVSATFAPLLVSGVGVLPISGDAAATFGALQVSAVGLVSNGMVGVASVSFAALAASATGQLTVRGSVAASFAPLAATGMGQLQVVGSAVTTFAPMVAVASGTVGSGIAGAAIVTFAPLVATVAGRVDIVGAGAATFPALQVAASGQVSIMGAASAAFGALQIGGAARLSLQGVGAAAFAPFGASVLGGLPVRGAGATAFGALQVSGIGSLVSAVDPNLLNHWEPYADGSDASSIFPNYVAGGDVLKSYLDTGAESPNWDGIGVGNKFASAEVDPGALSEFSVELWWFEDFYDAYDGMVAVADGGFSSDGEMTIIRAANTGNAMRTQVRYNGGANTRTATFGNGTDAPTGAWRHFAIVLNAGGHFMYDHGVLSASYTSSAYQGGRADAPGTISAYTMVTFANAASILGAGGIGGGSGFRGKIAGLKMWDRTLIQADITATVAAGPLLPGG